MARKHKPAQPVKVATTEVKQYRQNLYSPKRLEPTQVLFGNAFKGVYNQH